MCAGGGGEQVYGKMDYYPDEKKKGGGEKNLIYGWFIIYWPNSLPQHGPVSVTPPLSYTPAC